MALHAKLQLSARRWRAPLWSVVLPLCDWLTGLGEGETSSLPPSFYPSLLLFSFPSLVLLVAVLYSLTPGSGCVSLPLSLSVWHNSSNFSSVARDVWGLHPVYISFSSSSVWFVISEREDVFIWQILQHGLWKVLYHVWLPSFSPSVLLSFLFLQTILMNNFHT